MPKTNIAASTAMIADLTIAKSNHSVSLVLATLPASFILYYIYSLGLFGTDWQFLFLTIALTAGLCILIYASVRVAVWLLYAVVAPGLVWLLYIAVHGLAWLLRTVIVPGLIWLVCVGAPVLARLVCAVLCDLAPRLRNWGRSLKRGIAQRA